MFLILLLCVLSACHQTAEGDKAKAVESRQSAVAKGTTYSVDTSASKIIWVGTKLNVRHRGNLKILSGSLGVADGTINSGMIMINVSSLSNEDLKEKEKFKLEGHLKSADFFDVNKFPTAQFQITGIQKFDPEKSVSVLPGATHRISGNLILRGVSRNVTFPAEIKMDEKKLVAIADFNINRADWGMNYKGANNPQNWLISKDVNIKLHIVAQ